MVDFVFFQVFASVISLEPKKKGGAGFPFAGWCIINTASKIHIQICKIEWGVAKQRLCPHLSGMFSKMHLDTVVRSARLLDVLDP